MAPKNSDNSEEFQGHSIGLSIILLSKLIFSSPLSPFGHCSVSGHRADLLMIASSVISLSGLLNVGTPGSQ